MTRIGEFSMLARMSLTRSLIELIRHKPVKPADLDIAALFTLDAVACAYAGSATPVGAILRDWASDTGLDRKRQALSMAACAHITETDDLHRRSVTHPGCVVVPAALALAEPTGADGARLLTAILQGFEAMCRIGAALGPGHYRIWHNTSTCGAFGAAMAAASLLELDDRQTLDALGNAGTQAGGLWQFIETAAMSKHLHAGRATESGLLAAELARHGFTGPERILEGARGLFAGTCPDPAPDNILAEPDAAWQLAQTSIKPWPSCRHTHPVIDCALEIHAGLDGALVREVRIETYQAALDVCDARDPDNEYRAKFSLQHNAAIALLDGAVGLDSFDQAARHRAADLRARVHSAAAEPYRSRYPGAWGAGVTVDSDDGRRLHAVREHCRGDPELPLSAAQMRSKALGLMVSGGLEQLPAERLCEQILSLAQCRQVPALFDDFQRHQNPAATGR